MFMQGQPWWGANIVKSVSSLNITSGEYRFGFYQYVDATNWTGTDGAAVGHLEAVGKIAAMGIEKESGAYYTLLYGTPVIKMAYPGNLNGWNKCEVVVDYDASTVKYYLNGSYLGTNALSATSSYQRLNFGSGSSGPGQGYAAVYYDLITIQKTR